MRIALAITIVAWVTAFPPTARSQVGPEGPGGSNRAVYLDSAGVVRWRDDRKEVTLFGANYVLPTASDYRAAGYLHADRKQMIDEDMAQFARMGWDGLRLTFWGDWEASDSAGNLIANDHLDLHGLPDRPGAGARHLHAVQPDPALQLELARRDAARRRDSGLRPRSSARSGWAPTRRPSRRRSTTCARS